ncbi:MAG: hypothetical protein ACTSUP_04525 [Candidatus Heimdallarchaeaceae archaeon]
MKKKQTFNIHLPDTISEQIDDIENIVDHFLSNYKYLVNLELDDLTNEENLEQELDKFSEEFNQISQIYGKLRQEYGVLNFHGNELFTRNTLTGLKLGLVMGKLERAKSIWGEQLTLDYDAAKELIQYFFDRYLKKSEDDD